MLANEYKNDYISLSPVLPKKVFALLYNSKELAMVIESLKSPLRNGYFWYYNMPIVFITSTIHPWQSIRYSLIHHIRISREKKTKQNKTIMNNSSNNFLEGIPI